MVLIVWWIAISHLLFPSLGDENLRIRRVPFTCALSSLHQQTVQRSFPVSADSHVPFAQSKPLKQWHIWGKIYPVFFSNFRVSMAGLFWSS